MYYSLISSMRRTPASAFDADAQAFITATAITDSTQQNAINTLVLNLKSYGIWTKTKAIYPMVGGTATTHKYNLKDPRDDNSAFRLSFIGGWTHASTGAKPNGSTGYANTFLTESTTLTANSEHISIYSRTNIIGLYCDIGTATATTQSNIYSNFSGNFYPRIQASNGGTGQNLNTAAMFMSNRVISTQVQGWRNTTKYTVTNNSIGRSTVSFFLSNANLNGSPDSNYSPRELAFASIGDGLTDTEVSNFYTAVQAFQTTLSRNV